MTQTEADSRETVPTIPVRQKLRGRLQRGKDAIFGRVAENDPVYQVLGKLPETILELLDEDTYTEGGEVEVRDRLKDTLSRFGFGHYSVAVDDKKIAFTGSCDYPPSNVMVMNASMIEGYKYEPLPFDAGWILSIPKKAPVPSIANPSSISQPSAV